MRVGGRTRWAWVVAALLVGVLLGVIVASAKDGGLLTALSGRSPTAGAGTGSAAAGTTPNTGASAGANSGASGGSGAGASGGGSVGSPTSTGAPPATIGTFSGLCSQPTGPTETATVVRIVDGDTIIVERGQDQERLRYIGMDTPEIVKPDTPVQPYGPQAATANDRLVSGKTVTLEKDVSEVDQYGRLLRFVWLRDSTQPSGWLMVDRVLLRDGLAKVTTFPPDVKCVGAFLADQRYAQSRGLGLWSGGAGFGGSAPGSGRASASASAPVGFVGPGSTASATSSAPTGSAAFYRPPGWDGISDVDCKDFQTHAQAQSFFIGTGGSRTNDPYRLDADHDGLACESLP